jgi:hypothetical protein
MTRNHAITTTTTGSATGAAARASAPVQPVVFSHPDQDEPVDESRFAPVDDAHAESYRDAAFFAPPGLATVDPAELPPAAPSRRPVRRQTTNQTSGRRYVRRTR